MVWFLMRINDFWRILHWTNSMINNQFYKYCRGERNKKIQMSVMYFCVILRVGAWHSALYIKHNNNKQNVSYYTEKFVRVDNILKKWLPYWYKITILFRSLENHGIIRQCQITIEMYRRQFSYKKWLMKLTFKTKRCND